jgi:hypothetical protein
MSDKKVEGDFIVLTDKVRDDMNNAKDEIWPYLEFIKLAKRIIQFSSWYPCDDIAYDGMTIEVGGVIVKIEGDKQSFFKNLATLQDSVSEDVAKIREAKKLLSSLEWYQDEYKKPLG